MPALPPLTPERLAVLTNQTFRDWFTDPVDKRYFRNADECLRSIGPGCRRLPYIYKILTDKVLATQAGWDWFHKKFPKVPVAQERPTKADKLPIQTTKKLPTQLPTQSNKKAQQQRAKDVEALNTPKRVTSIDRAILTLKNYRDRKQ